MRVLVCGGRGYRDVKRVHRVLDDLHFKTPISALIHGAAVGADEIAETWALSRQIDYCGFPAKWDKYGSAAGPIRNALMIEDGKPDLVIAFPGGRGTANMVRQAQEAGVEVRHVEIEGHIAETTT